MIQMRYTNYYLCTGDLEYREPHEPMQWEDEWSCCCNDKCPKCNSEIEPYASYDCREQDWTLWVNPDWKPTKLPKGVENTNDLEGWPDESAV